MATIKKLLEQVSIREISSKVQIDKKQIDRLDNAVFKLVKALKKEQFGDALFLATTVEKDVKDLIVDLRRIVKLTQRQRVVKSRRRRREKSEQTR